MKIKIFILSLCLFLSLPLSAQFFTTLPAYTDEDYIEKTPYVIISEGYANDLTARMKEHLQQELFFSHRKFVIGEYRHDLWELDYGFKFQITITCEDKGDHISCSYIFTGPEDIFTLADLYNYLDSGIVDETENDLDRIAAIIIQEFNKTVDVVYTTFVKGVQKQLGMKDLDGILGPKTRKCIKKYQIFLVSRGKIQGASHLALTGNLNLKTMEHLATNYPDWAFRYPIEYFTCR